MKQRVFWAGLALVLGMGGLTQTDVRADEKDEKKEKADSPAPTGPKSTVVESKFSGFVFVADIQAEVVQATDSTVTLRVFYPVQSRPTGRAGAGGRGGRPQIGSRGRGGRPGGGVKWEHHDYTLDYHPDAQVRVKTLPKKTDADGKRVEYTSKELQELKEPAGFPGYAANKGDLNPGAIVEAYLIRDRAIPAAKATENDIKVKWVKVVGQASTPPTPAGGKAAPKKK